MSETAMHQRMAHRKGGRVNQAVAAGRGAATGPIMDVDGRGGAIDMHAQAKLQASAQVKLKTSA